MTDLLTPAELAARRDAVAGSCADSLKRVTSCASTAAWSCMLDAAAAASSTSAAFCCVTLSISVIAWLTWPMPVLCSCEAAVMSAMMSVTRDTEATT